MALNYKFFTAVKDMNSKREEKRNRGHVVQIQVCSYRKRNP